MDWIFDNFQILALVGIAFASWLKSRADAKAAEREEQEAREQMGQPEEIFGPPEQWIGNEDLERQSPPQLPQPPPLRRATQELQPPPLQQTWADEAALEAKRQMDIQERLREIRETKAVTTGGAAATRERQSSRKSAKVVQNVSPVSANLRARLRQRGEIRRAVLMREILGPPVGLR